MREEVLPNQTVLRGQTLVGRKVGKLQWYSHALSLDAGIVILCLVQEGCTYLNADIVIQ